MPKADFVSIEITRRDDGRFRVKTFTGKNDGVPREHQDEISSNLAWLVSRVASLACYLVSEYLVSE